MDEKRLKGLLGLAVRAGHAVFGEEGCRRALQAGGGLLLVDAGASANTLKRYEALCRRENRVMAQLPEGLLAEATGRPGAAMVVKEGPFSEQVKQVIGCSLADNNQ